MICILYCSWRVSLKLSGLVFCCSVGVMKFNVEGNAQNAAWAHVRVISFSFRRTETCRMFHHRLSYWWYLFLKRVWNQTELCWRSSAALVDDYQNTFACFSQISEGRKWLASHWFLKKNSISNYSNNTSAERQFNFQAVVINVRAGNSWRKTASFGFVTFWESMRVSAVINYLILTSPFFQ